MSGEISIRPSKDIRTNYAEVSALAHRHPVAITVNGREDTVLLSHADFMEQQRMIGELQDRLAVYAQLAQSQDDIKLGRVQTLHAAVENIYKDIDNLDL
ncbi:MAG: type II toxin-antitoxin system Phd/YefM family antitoxin [Clostridia bacterium]|nr:type II toxin-antitoxin system Phd/YefM family antitoxin [Clostridia bacterium]